MIPLQKMKPFIMSLKKINVAFVAATMLAISINVKAQRPAPSTYHSNLDTSRIKDIRERLVQLALQNPGYEVSDRKVNIADLELRKAKGSWLNVFSAQGNLNEFSIQSTTGVTGAQNIYYPRWNLSATIPFDFFSQKNNDVKIARENLYIASAEKNEHFRRIRAEVLTKYEDFLMHKEKLELQNRITSNLLQNYMQKEKDFEDGLITVDEYDKAYATYGEQQMKRFEFQRNFNVAKLDLELTIGAKLEDVLGMK
jgi:outer membrane protein TolC